MSASKTKAFIDEMATTIPVPVAAPRAGDRPTERRFKLSTIRSRCGLGAMSEKLRAELTDGLAELGLYMSPALHIAQAPGTWITISRRAPSPQHLVGTEEMLEMILHQNPSAIKGLPRGISLERQMPVPGRLKVVDLTGMTPTDIYLIELKKAGGRKGVDQLADYMDGWKESGEVKEDGRKVHGILITGSDDPETRAALAEYSAHAIVWHVYDYQFSLNRVQ